MQLSAEGVLIEVAPISARLLSLIFSEFLQSYRMNFIPLYPGSQNPSTVSWRKQGCAQKAR